MSLGNRAYQLLCSLYRQVLEKEHHRRAMEVRGVVPPPPLERLESRIPVSGPLAASAGGLVLDQPWDQLFNSRAKDSLGATSVAAPSHGGPDFRVAQVSPRESDVAGGGGSRGGPTSPAATDAPTQEVGPSVARGLTASFGTSSTPVPTASSAASATSGTSSSPPVSSSESVDAARATAAPPELPSKQPLTPPASATPPQLPATPPPSSKPPVQVPNTTPIVPKPAGKAEPLRLNLNNAANWTVIEKGGSSLGKGTATFGQGKITLREGDSFLLGLEHSFTVPPQPTSLEFSYDNLTFDTTDPDFVNDGLEFALLDGQGESLVSAFGSGRDAFFNATEGETVAQGAGLTVTDQTLSLDISQLKPGSAARFVARLINNDDDTQSTVQLVGSGNEPPVVTVQPVAGFEGQVASLNGTFTDAGDTGTHAAVIDWGDGSTSNATIGGTAAARTLAGTHVYADNGAYPIKLTVTDSAGEVGTAAAAASIANVAPDLAAGFRFKSQSIAGGHQLLSEVTGSFTDPGFTSAAAGTRETFTTTINWGDGQTQAVNSSVTPGSAAGAPSKGTFAATHLYANPGLYTVTVRVADDDGGADEVLLRYGIMRIDVVPTINISRKGNIPVKVLDAPGFNPSRDLDASSMRFGPGGARESHGSIHGGGMTHFGAPEAAIRSTDTTAFLYAKHKDGTLFVGMDTIRLTPSSTGGNANLAAAKFFVADPATDTVYRYTASGGTVGSYAADDVGTNVIGVASNAAGDAVWTIDGTTHHVSVQGPTGAFLGAWQATGLTAPTGIATDGTDVWIADKGARRVYRFVAAAALRDGVAAPSSWFPLHADNLSASDVATNGKFLWVTDDAKDEVFVYDSAGAFAGRWKLDPRNADASGLTLNPAGGTNLWVVDRVDRQVYRYGVGTVRRSGAETAAAVFNLAAANRSPEGIADPPEQTPSGDSTLGPDGKVTFTASADFAGGTMFNANATDVPGEVRLNDQLETFPFIWISNSGEGTVSKFDTVTGDELGRYRTGNGPVGINGVGISPSRTAVTGDGDVWVANRAFNLQGSIVKVLNTGFIDRNGNGVVDTSTDSNNNRRIDPSEVLPWDANGDGQPDDERIALSLNVGRSRSNPNQLLSNGIPRSIAIDANDNVWVGLYNLKQYEAYSPSGTWLATVPTQAVPYGAVVDAQGQLYGATRDTFVEQIDTNTKTWVRRIEHGGTNYGVTIDPRGALWVTTYEQNTLYRIDPSAVGSPGAVRAYTSPLGGKFRGVGIDDDNNVWVASNEPHALLKFSFAADGTTMTNTQRVMTGNVPSAAVVDADGFVWTTSYGNQDNKAWKIDPDTVTVVPGWPIATGSEPYNYSDMTGRVRLTVTDRAGTWKEIVDAKHPQMPWGRVDADADVPLGTAVTLRVRAADQRALLASRPWLTVASGQALAAVRGRYLEVETTLRSTIAGTTPALRELSVATAALAPTVAIESPGEGSTVRGGEPVLISGVARAFPLPNRIVSVTINNAAVEALDEAGGFFARVTPGLGLNVYTAVATDAFGQTATATLTLRGVQSAVGSVDFASLTESPTFAAQYARTSFNRQSNVLYADVAIRNTAQYALASPLLLGVTNISDPAVKLRGQAGVAPDGTPYYDLGALLGADATLAPGELSGVQTLSFYNPGGRQFTYDLVLLGRGNRPPAFVSVPDVEAIIDKSYRYDAAAVDPDLDAVTFALLAAPDGMTIDPDSGLIDWRADAGDAGNHSVHVRAADGKGGRADQKFTVGVIAPPPNRPPVFTSIPVVETTFNATYTYQATARDADDDQLSFEMLAGPGGMTVDAATGLVRWSSASTSNGAAANVTLRVSDGRGGEATQTYSIRLLAATGNHAPVIVSGPLTDFNALGPGNAPAGNVDPRSITLSLPFGAEQTLPVSITLPPINTGQSFADVVFVVDESGSMSGEHDWIEAMVLDLEAKLLAKGIGPNRYALVGFGGGGEREPGHFFNLMGGGAFSLYGPDNVLVSTRTVPAGVLPTTMLNASLQNNGMYVLALPGNNTAGPINYSFKPTAVNVKTTPLTLGVPVAAELELPGEQHRYTFTLTDRTRVYFDSLGGRSEFRWSLVGPPGRVVDNQTLRTFENNTTQAFIDLPAGSYTLSLNATADAVGEYGFTLSDVASAQPLALSTPTAGALTEAGETDLFRFAASAGDNVYFDVQSRTGATGATWRLVDPFGNIIFTRDFGGAAGDIAVTLPRAGNYTLLIEGASGESGEDGTYGFAVFANGSAPTPLTLGATVAGTVTNPGAKVRYGFELSEPTLLYFDNQSSAANLNWSLTGPTGTIVDAQAFTSTDGSSASYVDVPAGQYQLTVGGAGDASGAFRFRLVDFASATPLVPGTPVAGALDPANEADLYRFDAVAGDRFFFDVQARAGASNATWRLIDAHGQQVFSTSFSAANDIAPAALPTTGTYTLIVNGAANDATVNSYTFNVQPVSQAATPLTLGAEVSGTITPAGQQQRYSFDLVQRAVLYFDSLANSSTIRWSLSGPRGVVVDARSFNQGELVQDLPPGAYTLLVSGSGDAVGPYRFRLRDLADPSSATAIVPGTPVAGTLASPNGTDLYRFTAAAGQRFFFDAISATAGGRWQLIDPFGNAIFSSALSSDIDTLTAAANGTYTLLYEGSVGATAPNSYSFNVVPVVGAPPAALALGARTDGTLAAPGQSLTYTFELAQDALLYLDSLTNSNRLRWSLSGPTGTVVSNRLFNATDGSGFADSPALPLRAGAYVLTVNGSGDATGPFSFRMLDLADAPALTPGATTTGALTAGNATETYRLVAAAAGDTFQFDFLSGTNAGAVRWRLINPVSGASVFNTSLAADVNSVVLPSAGAYTLLIEGAINVTTAVSYSFRVNELADTPAEPPGTPLTIGADTAGAIAVAGERDTFTFDVPSRSLLYFDALASSNLLWSLAGPGGALVTNRSLSGSDGNNFGGEVAIDAHPGRYTLTVNGSGAATGAYQFRLLDLALAAPMVPGVAVSDAVLRETDLYRFTAAAGQKFYFDVESFTGSGATRWRLISPHGATVFSNPVSGATSDIETLTLPVGGAYTLLLEGSVSNTTATSYALTVRPVSDGAGVARINELTLGAIGGAGEQDRYTFALAERTLLYFDSQTNDANLQWSLAGPGGAVATNLRFNAADVVLDLPGGAYTLSVDGLASAVGAYEFRLAGLTSGAPLTPGTPVAAQPLAARATNVYTFDAGAGQLFYADHQSGTNLSGARWRLIDPHGAAVFNSALSSDVAQVSLPFTGTYALLVESANTTTLAGTYSFNLQPIGKTATPLTLGADTTGAIAAPGERDTFTFDLTARTTLYFDTFTNNTNLTWTLTGPAGVSVDARAFSSSDTNIVPFVTVPAGSYTLAVRGTADATGAYKFRLHDTASSTLITPGVPVPGIIQPAGTVLYRLAATAGSQFFFDVQARTGAGSVNWRLFDPSNKQLFTRALTNPAGDVPTMTLTQTGTYLLVVESAPQDTADGTYTFNVQPVGATTLPLALGVEVAGAISAVAERDRYTFTLTERSLLYFDSLTSASNVRWTLTGPAGDIVSAQALGAADNLSGRPTLDLPAGDYTITLSGDGDVTGSYAFRLSDLAAAPALVPGTPQNGVLAPANRSHLYRFTATAGQRFFFDVASRTTGSSNAIWRLVDPYGNSLFRRPFVTNAAGDADVMELAASGDYTVLIEGAITDAAATDYAINVQPVSDTPPQPLTLGDGVSGTLATAGEQDRHIFTIASRSLLYFDSLTNSAALTWSLTGPSGTAVSSRAFGASDGADMSGNPVLNLTPGHYSLTVDGTGDATGAYAFRLLDLASAAPVTLNATTSGTLDPARQTKLYRIDATAGDSFSFDSLSSSSGGARWRLIDPFGTVVFNQALTGDVNNVTTLFTGAYTLLVEGRVSESAPVTYSFSAKFNGNTTPPPVTGTPLTLGADVTGSIGVAAERDDFVFTTAGDRWVYFDSLTTTANLNATLIAPNGATVFTTQARTDAGPFTLSVPGTYRLQLSGAGAATGSYAFRLADVDDAPLMTNGETVNGVLDPGLRTQLYRVSGEAGQQLTFLPGEGLRFGTAAQLSKASGDLVINGGFEDGYDGIMTGVNHNGFRAGAAVNVVLITDEDRDILNGANTFTRVFDVLASKKALLNVVVNGTFRNGSNASAVGVDSRGNAYLEAPAGAYTTSAGGAVASATGTTKRDYIDLAWATSGAAWDLNKLRAGGLPAQSFSNAFVDIKAQEIERQLAVDVVSSDPNFPIQNLTGPIQGIVANQKATFNVKFTGDGAARRFDLLFIRAGSNLVLGSIPVTVNDGTLEYVYPAQAVDADGDVLAWRLLEAPPDAAIDPKTGRIRWLPIAAGQYHFAVEVSDGRGGRDVQEYDVTVTVDGNNHDPVLTSQPPTVARVNRTFAYRAVATDEDGDRLSYYLTAAPEGMGIDVATGVLTWKPQPLQSGNHTVTLKVLDGRGGQATQTFTINVLTASLSNAAPSFASMPPLSGDIARVYRYAATATDADNDPLAFDLVTAPTGMTVDAGSGLLLWTPAAEQGGTHRVLLRVRDDQGGVAIQDFEVTVGPPNVAPVITSQPPPTATRMLPYEYRLAAADADGDPVTFALLAAPAGMTLDAASGAIRWTPPADAPAIAHVEVIARDGRGGEARQAFDLTLTQAAPNLAPSIGSSPRLSIRVGQEYLYAPHAVDPNGDPVVFSLETRPTGMTIDGDGVIRWTPAAAHVGQTNAVTLIASDGRGGFAEQAFTIAVVQEQVNRAPAIVTQPPGGATAGQPYRYDARAQDPDGDPIVWSLDAAPAGMAIDAAHGTLVWTPATSQLGPRQVIVRASDARGAYATQTFTLTARASNSPPLITSVPLTEAAPDTAYAYRVQATDGDGDALTFALLTGPTGMTVDPKTGLVRWNPESADVGTAPVRLRVSDGRGGEAVQDYAITVAAVATNRLPTVTSTPSYFALIGQKYEYAIAASDPDGDTLRYLLVKGPASMTIDEATGIVQWTPSAAQAGAHAVTVAVVDHSGAGVAQSFSVLAAQNTAPVITSTPILAATPGAVYRYGVVATDADGDRLTYRLDEGPAGMSIDTLGRITWTPAAAHVGPVAVRVSVIDPYGASDTQAYQLIVAADTVAPQVQIQTSAVRANLGTTISVAVLSSDNIGVVSRTLSVGGVPVALDANGRAQVTLATLPAVDLVATATDAAGLVGTASLQIQVIDTTDQTLPVATITSPTDRAVLTTATDVVGTATDANLVAWTLAVAPADNVVFTEIARGTTNVTGAKLGRLDPSTLANGSYWLRLSARDAGGNVTTDDVLLSVAGEQKLGNFRLSFNDLTVPVGRIPISFTRTYDTLEAGRSDDLGYGWRLEFRDTDLRTSVPDSGMEDLLIYNGFAAGDRVYVTLPGGKREGFTFQPQLKVAIYSSRLYKPAFVADPGVTSKLTVNDGYALVQGPDGTFVDSSGLGYNLEGGFFGDYTVTTKDGTKYRIDPASGDLRDVTDTNGNTLTFTENGITSSAGAGITFERDRGRITAVVDPAGNKIRYGYSADGDLVSVTDRVGNVTRLEYRADRPHYLEKVIDPLGRTGARAEYDASGRLARLFDAAGNPVELSHDLASSTHSVIDANGNQTTYVYDARGNITREVDAAGGVTVRTYDAGDNVLSETDPLGRVTAFTYDARGNVLSETDDLGHVTRYTYNALNQPLTVTDPRGNTTTHTYDAKGNLLATTDPNGKTTGYAYDAAGNPTSVTDASGNVTRFAYDAAGRLLEQTDAAGAKIIYTYDANGNRLTETTTLTRHDGVRRTLVTKYAYDANGRPTSVTDPEGGLRKTEYDAAGNVVATLDPLGRRTTFKYDARNLLTETRYPDGTSTQRAYDDNGNEIRTTDQLGRETHYVYDALDRLVETIYPDATPLVLADNPRTRTEFDKAGQVVAEFDERGNRTAFEYDDAGRQTLRRDALGHETTSSYDDSGRLVAQADALGRVTRFAYDNAGRRTLTTFADGSTARVAYDAQGRPASQTDPNGRVTLYDYDALGRLVRVTDALGQLTTYGYDEAGNLVRQTDANNHTTRHEYGGTGRRTATVLPLGQRSGSSYDLAGNLKQTTDFNGVNVTFDYDLMNRLVARHYPDGTGTTFTYTANGLRKTESDARGTTTYAYDERDRLAQRTEPDGRTIKHAWDAAGNRTATVTPARTMNYTFDALNRMRTAGEAGAGTATYAYDAVGNLVHTALPNGTTETRGYDDLNRLTLLTNLGTDGASVISSYAYTLDAAGHRTAVLEHDGRRVEYSYDPLYRLTQEKVTDAASGNRTFGYTYDPVGNRLTRTDTLDGASSYAYDANDRLLTETTAAGIATTYAYDDNGNTKSKFTSASDRADYTYDFENRLTGAVVTTGAGATTVAYRYDADGLRVARIADGAEVRNLNDTTHPFAQVVEEYAPAAGAVGAAAVTYLHGLDLVSQTRGGTTSVFHVDALGSVRVLSSGTGNVTDSIDFDAFGTQLGRSGSTVAAHLFAGEQRDAATGLDYLRARYLAPQLGRFVNVDPAAPALRKPATLNRYVYALNDPVNRLDPSGRFSLSSLSASVGIVDILSQIAFTHLTFGVVTATTIVKLWGPGFRARNLGMLMASSTNADVAAHGMKIYHAGNALIGLGVDVIFATKAITDLANTFSGLPSILHGAVTAPDTLVRLANFAKLVRSVQSLNGSLDDLKESVEHKQPIGDADVSAGIIDSITDLVLDVMALTDD